MKNIVCLLLLLPASLFAQAPASPEKIKKSDFVIGRTDTVFSSVLGYSRVVNIYLPQGYHPDSAARYPVIYLLDGSADEDFIHISGLVQFANFPWVNRLPNSIVVGIANIDRKHDFTFPTTDTAQKKKYPTTGGSAAFIAFIEKDLQPYIEKNFRCSPARMIVGQSLGGLLATEILAVKPELFTHYIIVSPSLWWDNESLLRRNFRCLGKDYTRPVNVYVAVGKEGRRMKRDARRLYRKLKKSDNQKVQAAFGYFPGEDHATILHLAVYRAFEAFSKMKE